MRTLLFCAILLLGSPAPGDDVETTPGSLADIAPGDPDVLQAATLGSFP